MVQLTVIMVVPMVIMEIQWLFITQIIITIIITQGIRPIQLTIIKPTVIIMVTEGQHQHAPRVVQMLQRVLQPAHRTVLQQGHLLQHVRQPAHQTVRQPEFLLQRVHQQGHQHVHQPGLHHLRVNHHHQIIIPAHPAPRIHTMVVAVVAEVTVEEVEVEAVVGIVAEVVAVAEAVAVVAEEEDRKSSV